MQKQIKLAGWYGIGSREVDVTAVASRDGVNVTAFLPGDSAGNPMDYLDGESESKLLSWDELGDDADEVIRNVAADLVRAVVTKCLPSKKAGEVYSA